MGVRVYAIDAAEQDQALQTESLPQSSWTRFYGEKGNFQRAWFISLGLACAMFIYKAVIGFHVYSAFYDYSDSSHYSNFLSNEDVVTPVAWLYLILVVLCHTLVWTLLCMMGGCCCGHGDTKFCQCCHQNGSSCHWLWCRRFGYALYISAILFQEGVLLGSFMFFPCIRGFPGYKFGGWCRCDGRPALVLDGTPRYVHDGTVPQNLRVAYLGDTHSRRVEDLYKLIANVGHVSGVVVNGDLDYVSEPEAWRALYRKHLGDMPLYVTVGNHDTHIWREYQDATKEQYAASNVTECSGNIGVKEVCTHHGVGLLLSGAGSMCGGLKEEHSSFIQEALRQFSQQKAIWRTCNFHKNNHIFHTLAYPISYAKPDEVGVDNLRYCMENGAMIFTAHKHEYARTHELDHMSRDAAHVSRVVPPGSNSSNPIRLGRGKTFVVVNGLGGMSAHRRDEEAISKEWWAATYGRPVSGRGGRAAAKPGAFICDYHVEADPRLARCYFKTTDGQVIDEFYVKSEV